MLSDSADGKTWGNTTTVPIVALDPATHKRPAGPPKGAVPAFITGPYFVGVCACSHNPQVQGYAGFTAFTGLDVTKMQYYAVHQSTKNKKNY